MDSTLLKGLTLLEALATSAEPRGISDLARELELTKSNVHRTVQTLVTAGYARVGTTPGTYECTLKLFEVASRVVARVDVRATADPYMHGLAYATGETVHLAALEGFDVIYLHKIESPQPVRAYSTIGGRAPAYCVATGKALLAQQRQNVLTTLPRELTRHTGKTITDRHRLLEELAGVRRLGYAVNRGEWRESVCGLGAAVFDAAGLPSAAIGISGPAERLRPAVMRKYAPAVVAAASELSAQIGCTDYDDAATRGPQRRRR